MIRVATFTAFLALTGAAILSESPEPSLDLYHHDSGPADAGYHEVFRVVDVNGFIEKQDLQVTIDGEPIEAAWTGAGHVQVGDDLAFHLVSYDAPRTLEIRAGILLERITFGGGAGTPVPP